MVDPHLAINGWFAGQPASGSGQYLMRLLEELVSVWRGPITVLVPAGHPSSPGLAPGGPAFMVRHVPVPITGPLGKVWFEQVGVPAAARAAGAHLIHIPYLGAPLSAGVPVIVTVHDLIQIVHPRLRGGPLNRAYNLTAAVGARKASSILTDSDYVRRDVIRRLRVPPKRVTRVYLGVDGRFHPHADAGTEAALRQRYSLEGPFILYAGGLDWRKNVSLLIAAYARSAALEPLVIAGEARSTRGSSFPDLRAEARLGGVGDRVRFIPLEEETKPDLYRAATAYVFPSLAEGFGLTPLEAMACGTPVLCSSATSLPEVVGDAALLFDPQDDDGLARLIRRVLGDGPVREWLRQAGLARAARFNWRRTAEETVDVMNAVLNSRPRSW